MAARTVKPLRISVAQLPITRDVRKNGAKVRDAMTKAASDGSRLVQFPEGMLSGYAKETIHEWSEVDWLAVREELQLVMGLAARLKIWVALGSSHPLTPPRWPHNSLYIISDEGKLVNRYDKRIVSYTEVTQFYTPGSEPVVFDVDGYRFGCVICVEINFPKLFIEYADLGVDCLLFSAYPVDGIIFDIKARAMAAIHNYWVSMAAPSETASLVSSGIVGPDGTLLKRIETEEGLVSADLDRNDPQFDIALNKAKPWRAGVTTDPRYMARNLNDPRSLNRTCL